MNNSQTQFLKKLNQLSRSGHRQSEIYNDFMLCTYNKLNLYAQFNPEAKLQEHRLVEFEDDYNELYELSLEGLDKLDCDFFGEISGEIGNLDKKYSGQCFTPFHVSYLCASIAMGDLPKTLETHPRISIEEPAAGSGGMIIAACKYAVDNGIQRHRLLFRAVELSFNVYLSLAVQLNIIGASAVCINGNSLSLERFNHTCTQGLMVTTPGWVDFEQSCISSFK